jgi:hypothetical protein
MAGWICITISQMHLQSQLGAVILNCLVAVFGKQEIMYTAGLLLLHLDI